MGGESTLVLRAGAWWRLRASAGEAAIKAGVAQSLTDGG